MKITNDELNIAANALQALGVMKLPIGWKIAMNIDAVKDLGKAYHEEANKIMDKYGTLKDDGTYMLKGGIEKFDTYFNVSAGKKQKEYEKKMSDLVEKKVEVTFTPIDIHQIISVDVSINGHPEYEKMPLIQFFEERVQLAPMFFSALRGKVFVEGTEDK